MNTKQPANWFKSFELGSNTVLSVSTGGGCKIEVDGKIMCMFPAKQLESMHLVFSSIDTSLIDKVMNESAKAKEQTRIEKEIQKVQNKASQHLQALHDIAKAKGLNPETYIAQVLSGKAG